MTPETEVDTTGRSSVGERTRARLLLTIGGRTNGFGRASGMLGRRSNCCWGVTVLMTLLTGPEVLRCNGMDGSCHTGLFSPNLWKVLFTAKIDFEEPYSSAGNTGSEPSSIYNWSEKYNQKINYIYAFKNFLINILIPNHWTTKKWQGEKLYECWLPQCRWMEELTRGWNNRKWSTSSFNPSTININRRPDEWCMHLVLLPLLHLCVCV